MSEYDDVEPRRGFLRQVVGVGSVLPLAGGIAAAAMPAGTAAQAAAAAPAATSLIG